MRGSGEWVEGKFGGSRGLANKMLSRLINKLSQLVWTVQLVKIKSDCSICDRMRVNLY